MTWWSLRSTTLQNFFALRQPTPEISVTKILRTVWQTKTNKKQTNSNRYIPNMPLACGNNKTTNLCKQNYTNKTKGGYRQLLRHPARKQTRPTLQVLELTQRQGKRNHTRQTSKMHEFCWENDKIPLHTSWAIYTLWFWCRRLVHLFLTNLIRMIKYPVGCSFQVIVLYAQ